MSIISTVLKNVKGHDLICKDHNFQVFAAIFLTSWKVLSTNKVCVSRLTIKHGYALRHDKCFQEITVSNFEHLVRRTTPSPQQ